MEPKLDGSKYSCQVILEKCTLEQAKDRSFPTDARLVRYKVDDKDYIDVARSAKASNIFDLYFDTYGMGAVQSIDYGEELYHRVSGDTSLLQTPKRKSEDKFKICRKNTRAIFWSVGFFHQNHLFRHVFCVKS